MHEELKKELVKFYEFYMSSKLEYDEFIQENSEVFKLEKQNIINMLLIGSQIVYNNCRNNII